MFSNTFLNINLSISLSRFLALNRGVSYDVFLLVMIMMMMTTFHLWTNGITCCFAETGDRRKKIKMDDVSGQNWTTLFGKIIASRKNDFAQTKV